MEADFCVLDLQAAIDEQLKAGVRTFLNGVAVGFDLLAAELVLARANEYPDVRLIACIPCENQDKYYSQKDKVRYNNVITVAEQIWFGTRYFDGCMLVRDEFMAKHADVLIAYCKKRTGGTAYTVRRYRSLHPDGEVRYL